MNTFDPATVRRLFLVGIPISFALLLVFHPLPDNGIYDGLHDHSRRWQVVHVTQLVFIGLLAVMMYLLVEGTAGRWTTVSRWALLPFVLFYGAFEAVTGIGTGVLIDHARTLPDDEQVVAAGIIEAYWDNRIAGNVSVFSVIGALSWLVAVVGAVVALRRIGAPRSALVLPGLGGLLFAISHAPPFGPVALVLIAAAVVRLGGRAAHLALPVEGTVTT